MKKLSMFLTMVSLSSNLWSMADDTAPTMTDATPKEGMSKKIEHMPGAMMKDTEHGVKKVGRGTKKMVGGAGHEMGKMTHMGRKRKMRDTEKTATSDSTSETTSAAK